VDPEELQRHVRAAESATRVLRTFTYWGGLEFDTEKRARLASVLDGDNLPEAALDNLIDRTFYAVEDLMVSDRPDAHRALDPEQLAKVCEHAAALAAAWGGLRHNFKDAVRYHLDGTLGFTSPAPSADQILKNCDRSERIFAVLNDDLQWFAGELTTLRDVLGADRSRNPFEYACVYRTASAWHETTGKIPTFSFNRDAVSGHSKTKFQKYLEEATSSRPIGDMILRWTLNAFKSALGDAKP
jgi:hypothetical protein